MIRALSPMIRTIGRMKRKLDGRATKVFMGTRIILCNGDPRRPAVRAMQSHTGTSSRDIS